MNWNFDDLRSKGVVGVLAFWLQISLFGMSVSAAIFAIYWMAITGSKIWLKAVGGSILAANFFLMFISLASFAFLLLSRMGINPLYPNFSHHLAIITAFVAQVMCCVLMGLATESEAEVCLNDIIDYCARNPTDAVVTSFQQSHSTDYSKQSYVAQRTTTAYDSVAAIFGVWLPLTLLYILCVSRLEPSSKAEKKPDHTPLRSNSEENLVRADEEEEMRENSAV